MEQLSKYEREAIAVIAEGDRQRDIILAQLHAASCKAREYTGVGLYTDLNIAIGTPKLDESRWRIEDMPMGHADHPDLVAGAGLILWVKAGYITCLESYTYGGDWPQDESLFRLST